MRKKLLLMLVLSILAASTLVGCSQASSSNPSALTILSITNGNVYVMKAGTSSWKDAQAGMSLEVGDTIKTDDDSNAQITFFDGSIIELYGGTEVKIISLDILATGSTAITLEQTIGTTISRVTKLLDPASRYEIETPTGVAAVRGSSMLVQVFPDESIWVANLEGQIWVNYNGVELQVHEGEVCIVRTNELPRFMPFVLPEGGDIVTDLAIDKSDSSDPVDPGTSLTYTLQITNNGPSDSTDTVVIDTLPSGVSFVSATNGGTYDPDSHAVSWAIGTLSKDASTSLNITVTVNESTPPGIITNVAMVSANESDSYSDNNVAAEVTTINIVNNPPVAVDDSATTSENTTVTIDVLSNDSDIDGDTLTVDSVTQGTNGSVINNGSNVTYIPDVGFNGTDSFTYTISDGKGGTDTGSVDVTVTETTARIRITVDQGPTALIYVQDTTTGEMVVDGNMVASATIQVAGEHSYCVWVGGDATRYVNSCPGSWSGVGTQTACGKAAAGVMHPVHFTQSTPS